MSLLALLAQQLPGSNPGLAATPLPTARPRLPLFDFFDRNPPIDSAVWLYETSLNVLFVLAFALYALFSLIVVRQVWLMDQTVKTPLAPVLKLLALAHLLVAVFVLFLVITTI